MRIRLMGFLAAGLFVAACGSSGPEPGSKEWCEQTPIEKQAEDPTALGKCLDAEG